MSARTEQRDAMSKHRNPFTLRGAAFNLIAALLKRVTLSNIKARLRRRRSRTGEVRSYAASAFDAKFYLEVYKDVAATGVDPLGHYLEHGWRENRNPSPTFNTRDYLDANPDVRESGICPLVHYVKFGIAEERPMRRASDLARVQIALINGAVPVAERVKPWLTSMRIAPLEAPTLRQAFIALVGLGPTGIVTSLSHDDYAIIFGGVQSCVSDEEHALRDRGWAYLHLCPAQPLPVLAEAVAADNFFVWIRLNGERLGVVSLGTLIEELGGNRLTDLRRVLVLHHLMGFSPERVEDISKAFAPEETIVWVHDFFTLCPSYALLRNDVAFCGGPDPDSQACSICVYGGAERKRHIARMARLFDGLKPSVFAPSETAMTFWLGHGALPHQRTVVAPHGSLVMKADRPDVSTTGDKHLRVAFAGAATYHKGWHAFKELAVRHFKDCRYSFFHLASDEPPQAPNIAFLAVALNKGQRHQMIDVLKANEIDVVVNWSLCYETFSFTAYEAVAAGAFVVARNAAGNVVPAISQRGVEQGLGLETEQELFDLFASGEIFRVATGRRFGQFRANAGIANYLGK